MPKSLTQKQLEKHLAQLSQEELVAEVGKLFKRFKEVQQYYQMEYGEKEDRKVVLEKYKQQIRRQFYSPRSGNPQYPKASELRRIISEFKKVAVFKSDVVDLILYRVECAVDFTNDFGDIDMPFYESTENAFNDVAKIIEGEQLHQVFVDRCQQIVINTSDIGWGFHDTMIEIYYTYFFDNPISSSHPMEKTKRLIP